MDYSISTNFWVSYASNSEHEECEIGSWWIRKALTPYGVSCACVCVAVWLCDHRGFKMPSRMCEGTCILLELRGRWAGLCGLFRLQLLPKAYQTVITGRIAPPAKPKGGRAIFSTTPMEPRKQASPGSFVKTRKDTVGWWSSIAGSSVHSFSLRAHVVHVRKERGAASKNTRKNGNNKNTREKESKWWLR